MNWNFTKSGKLWISRPKNLLDYQSKLIFINTCILFYNWNTIRQSNELTAKITALKELFEDIDIKAELSCEFWLSNSSIFVLSVLFLRRLLPARLVTIGCTFLVNSGTSISEPWKSALFNVLVLAVVVVVVTVVVVGGGVVVVSMTNSLAV